MSDADEVAELLEAAHATLRDTIQPAVPGEQRYAAAMVANALAIIARALRLAPVHDERERHLLADFFGDALSPPEELRRRLARDLRTGAIGPDREAALRALLQALVTDRLAVSSPTHRPGAS